MRFMNRILLPVLVLVGSAGVVLHHFSQSQEHSVVPAVGVNQSSELLRLKQLEAELAALKALPPSTSGSERDRMEAQLNALKQQMSALGRNLEKAPDPAAVNISPGEPATVAEKIAAEEEQSRQVAQFLDGTLASEAADPRWSAAAAEQISRSLASTAEEHTRLGEVRCASTFCRIEATHDSLEAEQGFILQLGQLDAFRQSEGFGQRVERGDGTVTATVFVSRSGHRLPNPSQATSPGA